jgi:hypothetical protein
LAGAEALENIEFFGAFLFALNYHFHIFEHLVTNLFVFEHLLIDFVL